MQRLGRCIHLIPSHRLLSLPTLRRYVTTAAPPLAATDDLLLLAAEKVIRSPSSAAVEPSQQPRDDDVRAAVKQVQDDTELVQSLEQMSLSEPDEELRALAELDLPSASLSLRTSRSSLYSLLASPPSPSLSALIELKSGIGGLEASRVTATLLRMYMRFAVRRGWKATVLETVSVGGGDIDAYKEALLEVKGEGAYKVLKNEAGVHKIQRVPDNDAKGRVQSSTAGVIVLPAEDNAPQEDADDLFDMKDVKVEVMRSRGAGGQHVNKTESAIRLTHHPTGVTVSMQDSRSQHENRTKAFRLLRSRLLALRMASLQASRRNLRLTQVQGTDRSDKIRTYSITQNRVTDHRVPVTVNGCQDALDGGEGLDFVTRSVELWEEEEVLKGILEAEEKDG